MRQPLGRTCAQSGSPRRAGSAFASEVDAPAGRAQDGVKEVRVGNRVLKLMVILLCSINALMWEFYTESTLMALLWAAVAVAFVVWIVDDINR
jgi:hypothetical protein